MKHRRFNTQILWQCTLRGREREYVRQLTGDVFGTRAADGESTTHSSTLNRTSRGQGPVVSRSRSKI